MLKLTLKTGPGYKRDKRETILENMDDLNIWTGLRTKLLSNNFLFNKLICNLFKQLSTNAKEK